MDLLDFNRSSVINVSARDGEDINTCRTHVLARCVIERHDAEEEYFLGKECIGEYMYAERGIAQVPTSEVCIVFGREESSLLKRFANHDHDVIQTGPVDVPRECFDGSVASWTDIRFVLNRSPARRLATAEEIIGATLNGEVLVGRTTLPDADNGGHAVLEYPIHYMNVHPPELRFQVDVGPVLYPDFTSTAESLVECMQLAYVLFNRLDEAEFALRVPTRVAADQEAEVLHYAHVIKAEARSELFSLG